MWLGIDIGTGSTRALLVDERGAFAHERVHLVEKVRIHEVRIPKVEILGVLQRSLRHLVPSVDE